MLHQLWLFAAALTAGFALALVYDIYRRLLLLRRPRRAYRHYLLPDALFSLLAICGLLLFWFLLTDGSLRFSAFVWMTVGAVIYAQLLAPRRPPIRPRPPQPGPETSTPDAVADKQPAAAKPEPAAGRRGRKGKPRKPPLPQRLVTRAAVLTWHGGAKAGGMLARLAQQAKQRLRRPPAEVDPDAALPETLETPSEATPEAVAPEISATGTTAAEAPEDGAHPDGKHRRKRQRKRE